MAPPKGGLLHSLIDGSSALLILIGSPWYSPPAASSAPPLISDAAPSWLVDDKVLAAKVKPSTITEPHPSFITAVQSEYLASDGYGAAHWMRALYLSDARAVVVDTPSRAHAGRNKLGVIGHLNDCFSLSLGERYAEARSARLRP